MKSYYCWRLSRKSAFKRLTSAIGVVLYNKLTSSNGLFVVVTILLLRQLIQRLAEKVTIVIHAWLVCGFKG